MCYRSHQSMFLGGYFILSSFSVNFSSFILTGLIYSAFCFSGWFLSLRIAAAWFINFLSFNSFLSRGTFILVAEFLDKYLYAVRTCNTSWSLSPERAAFELNVLLFMKLWLNPCSNLLTLLGFQTPFLKVSWLKSAWLSGIYSVKSCCFSYFM